MAEKEPPRHDETSRNDRTPVGNDLAPDGMDPESESDELEAGGGGLDDDDDGVEPDGARENPQR
jgi:hypothetical protein